MRRQKLPHYVRYGSYNGPSRQFYWKNVLSGIAGIGDLRRLQLIEVRRSRRPQLIFFGRQGRGSRLVVGESFGFNFHPRETCPHFRDFDGRRHAEEPGPP